MDVMDDYSLNTIRLYLSRNRQYLVQILRRYSDNVPDNITEQDAIRILVATREQAGNRAHVENTTSSIYRCARCGSRSVSVREAQLRSADEGSNTLCHCHECGHNSVY